MSKEKEYDITPNANRLINSLRSMGYELNTAVCDLIDNSIEANANKIYVQLEMDHDGYVEFSITDDGDGMSQDELRNAFTYGSNERTTPTLGKFGLGLKTSSTAFSRRLIVASKSLESDDCYSGYLDLDELDSQWKIKISPASDQYKNKLSRFSKKGSGTIVRWENIDNYLPTYPMSDHKKRYAAHKKQLENKVTGTGLKNHIAYTFSELIKGDTGVKIYLNDEEIVYKDLFLRNASLNLSEGEKIIPVEDPENNKIVGEFKLQAWCLPNKGLMNKDQRLECNYKNTTQGIYVFREKRLIASAETFKLWSKDPHDSLFRVELHFNNELDSFFKVSVDKGKLFPNEDLMAVLEDFTKAHRGTANKIYRRKAAETSVDLSKDIHKNTNKTIENTVLDLPASSKVEKVEDGQTTIINPEGKSTQLKLVYDNDPNPDALFVKTSSELPEDVLYQPTIDRDNNNGVIINTMHEFYPRVYLPQKLLDPNAYLAIDYLFYALSRAELRNTSEESKQVIEDIRVDISRTLRHLSENLPESKDE
jgi:hypothetical protein